MIEDEQYKSAGKKVASKITVMDNTEKIVKLAVERLSRILPLVANQQALDVPLQRLHKAILRAYVDRGRSLNGDEIAQYVDNIDEALEILKHSDLVIFDDNEKPVGAYPFTMEPRIHRVSVNGHTVHCMCALDALAVSPMYKLPVAITSQCHVTNDPVTIQQHGRKVLNEVDVADLYFGINWNAASENSSCADSLCTEMIFLKSGAVADRWLAGATDHRQIFQLNDAIEFSIRFFIPLVNE